MPHDKMLTVVGLLVAFLCGVVLVWTASQRRKSAWVLLLGSSYFASGLENLIKLQFGEANQSNALQVELAFSIVADVLLIAAAIALWRGEKLKLNLLQWVRVVIGVATFILSLTGNERLMLKIELDLACAAFIAMSAAIQVLSLNRLRDRPVLAATMSYLVLAILNLEILLPSGWVRLPFVLVLITINAFAGLLTAWLASSRLERRSALVMVE